jgi:hypothetical protein
MAAGTPPRIPKEGPFCFDSLSLSCIIGHLGDFVTLGFCTTAASASRLVGGHACDAHELPFSPNGPEQLQAHILVAVDFASFIVRQPLGLKPDVTRATLRRLVFIALPRTGDLHIHNPTHPSPIHILGSEVK